MDRRQSEPWRSTRRASSGNPRATTTFYMGGRTAARIAETLARHGMAADTPVTICSSVSRKSQKQWNGELRDLGAGMDLIGVGAVFAAAHVAGIVDECPEAKGSACALAAM
jgi:uroporphyrin-III C-methyltransferase/precorrin-2 dehydrogenase/sirohydrochlorin ferrochelatase